MRPNDQKRREALSLLRTSLYGTEMRERIERFIMNCQTSSGMNRTLELLKDNQLDPVSHGGNYNQGDIIRKLQEHT